jgi:hypothetical protein
MVAKVVPDRESLKKAGIDSSAGAAVDPFAPCPSAARVDVLAEEAPLSDFDSKSNSGSVEISVSETIMSSPVPAPGRRSA